MPQLFLLKRDVQLCTDDRDSMSSRARIPLKSDIATLVDSKAIILVHDRAGIRPVIVLRNRRPQIPLTCPG